MSYEVLVANLRAAAASYHGIEDRLGEPMELERPQPDTLGHVELAAWLGAVLDQSDQAHQALSDGMSDLASSLDTAAAHYETTDQQAGQGFGTLGSGLPGFPLLPGPGPVQAPGQSPFLPFPPGGQSTPGTGGTP